MSVFDRVNSLMQERGITIKALAEGIGVSIGNVTDWRSGKAKPGTDAVIKMSRFFNVTTDYLFGETEEKNRFIIRDESGVKRGWAEVFDEADKSGLSPDDLRAFIEAANRANRKKTT
jgi:transcriptional regulator with XRE-family HTH domain